MPEIDTSNLADPRTDPGRYSAQPVPVLVFAQDGREVYEWGGYDVCALRGRIAHVRQHKDT